MESHFVWRVPVTLRNMEPAKSKFRLMADVYDAEGAKLGWTAITTDLLLAVTDAEGNYEGTLTTGMVLRDARDVARAVRWEVNLYLWDVSDPAIETFRPVDAGDLDETKFNRIHLEGRFSPMPKKKFREPPFPR